MSTSQREFPDDDNDIDDEEKASKERAGGRWVHKQPSPAKPGGGEAQWIDLQNKIVLLQSIAK